MQTHELRTLLSSTPLLSKKFKHYFFCFSHQPGHDVDRSRTVCGWSLHHCEPQYFQGIGYPGWVAHQPVIEIPRYRTGGVYARQVALALVPVMLVVVTVHADNGCV
jgi:hypothetical protein